MNAQTDPAPGQNIAISAEALYLANLLLLPGLCFLVLLWLYLRHRRSAPALARCHLRQTMAASLWGAGLLIVVNLLILLAGGWDSANVWMYVLLYFTVGHSSLVLLGMIGLAKAMAGKSWRYPLLGVSCNG